MEEAKDFNVTITVTLKTWVSFAAIPRETPLTIFDAISNAFGHIPSEQWAAIEDGFGGEFAVTVGTEVSER